MTSHRDRGQLDGPAWKLKLFGGIAVVAAAIIWGRMTADLLLSMQPPSLGGDVSLLEAATTIAIFATGYVLHEALHLFPIKAWGIQHETTILPRPDGTSWLHALVFGTVYQIRLTDDIPHWKVAVIALMPLAMLPAPLTALALMLQYPVIDTGTLLIVFAWFAVSIPSLADWLSAAGRYDSTPPALTGGDTHGQ